MEGGQGSGGSEEWRRRGGGGGAGLDGFGLGTRNSHTGGNCKHHRVGGLPGSQRLQWSGAEQGRGLTYPAGTLKSMTKLVTIQILRKILEFNIAADPGL